MSNVNLSLNFLGCILQKHLSRWKCSMTIMTIWFQNVPALQKQILHASRYSISPLLSLLSFIFLSLSIDLFWVGKCELTIKGLPCLASLISAYFWGSFMLRGVSALHSSLWMNTSIIGCTTYGCSSPINGQTSGTCLSAGDWAATSILVLSNAVCSSLGACI